MSRSGERRRQPSRDRRVPACVLDARAQVAAFERIVAACPACVSDERNRVPDALAQRLAVHPRLRSRAVARLREEVGDLRAFAEAVGLRDAALADGTSAEVLAGLLYHIGSFGPALDRGTVGTIEATFGATATGFALRHAAVSPMRSADLDLSGPGLASRVAAAGRAILAMYWGLSFGSASRWLAAPSSSDPFPLLSGEAVTDIVMAVTSHMLAEAGPTASGDTGPVT